MSRSQLRSATFPLPALITIVLVVIEQATFFQVPGHGDVAGGVGIVCHHHNGLAEFLIQPGEQVENVFRGDSVEVARRLPVFPVPGSTPP